MKGFIGLGAVDQPPQRDVDPARRLVLFDVAEREGCHGLGYGGG